MIFTQFWVDRQTRTTSSIFIDTLLHEVTKKRKCNAARVSTTCTLFITVAASACELARPLSWCACRILRTRAILRPFSRAYRGCSLKKCLTIARPLNRKHWQNNSRLSYRNWLNLMTLLKSKNEVVDTTLFCYILIQKKLFIWTHNTNLDVLFLHLFYWDI